MKLLDLSFRHSVAIFIFLLLAFFLSTNYLMIKPDSYQPLLQRLVFLFNGLLLFFVLWFHEEKADKRIEKGFLVIAGVLFFVIYLLNFSPFLAIGMDSGTYLTLAKSMGDGQGFQMINGPTPQPHVLYGFGYPLILTLAYWIGGLNFPFLNALNGLFFALFLWGLYEYFKNRKLPIKYVWLILLVTGTHSMMHFYGSIIMTEAVFMALSIGIFITLERYEHSHEMFNRWFWALLLLLVYAYMVKAVALGALAAVFFHLVLRKQSKRAWILIGLFVLLSLPWVIRCMMIDNPDSPTYMTYFSKFFTSTADTTTLNAGVEMTDYYRQSLLNFKWDYLRTASLIFFYGEPFRGFPFINLIILVLILSVVLYTFRNRDFMGFYVIMLSFAGILQSGFHRYYIVLFPFFVYIMLDCALWIRKREKNFAGPLALYFFFAIMIVFTFSNFSSLSMRINLMRTYGLNPPELPFAQLGEDCRNILPSGSVIAARKAPEFFLLSGYHCVYNIPLNIMAPSQYDPKFYLALFENFIKSPAEYLVVDQMRRESVEYWGSIVKAKPEIFVPVKMAADKFTGLYKVNREGMKNLAVEIAQLLEEEKAKTGGEN